ncbi:lysine N(6)-hydroxylase/L-ornithine N(5)-oxygenase family protein [Chitinophaga rhizophila]|uniref:SidA/IucD/PvdA family monooxygenase n=1 Tax=Chitinophaga rhizophila TaxID=2866212 RepID=A0ABS7G6B2_9BACT|nr:SidA/IucD/PvdA family monooxygenase [Chitinophaga rhizophila]MBW8683154.1 SidA/IucD/PvdA family monooxygenase [Chitinophaga rhizophila]
MKHSQVYNLIGIGIGPFNLGLAALLHPVKDVSAVFFDQADGFDWHPGLMLESATLQTPFMGTDLVTMADPTSWFSFLNFLKQTDRLYPFFIRENFYMLRKEYNLYCQWAVEQLPSCRFSQKVSRLVYGDGLYEVTVQHTKTGDVTTWYAEKLVLGTGTQPYMPPFINREQLPGVMHTSAYLPNKADILEKGNLTIIGSGQSAAEIFYDLLPETKNGLQLNWFTRADRFSPMEYSKLTLELTSPEYVDYFYQMPPERRRKVLSEQNTLYKGINYDLINEIFDQMYQLSVGSKKLSVQLNTNSELTQITPAEGSHQYTLHFNHLQQQQRFTLDTNSVILATGYKYNEPAILSGIEERIRRTPEKLMDAHRNYTVDINNSEIFVQNVELHTHGFVTPDLGMGAYRNSHIINAIAGREVYKIEQRIAYQDFGVTQVKETAADLAIL